MSSSALSGLHVLEVGGGIAASLSTKLMGQFGAEVIKIEPPHRGDWTRHRGPFYQDIPHPEHSLLFAYLNTNKRSVTLDLDTSFGQEALRRLAAQVDIMVESFPDGYLDQRGLGPERLRAENRRLVVVSLPLFDRRGPYANWKAAEINLYAMSGLMSIVGGVGKPPLKAGGYQAQYMAGLQACAMALFAAFRARVSGEGAWVDTSVEETCAKILEHCRDYTVEGATSERADEKREHGNSVLPCGEGYLTVTLYYFQMQTLAELLGDPSIATDPRFTSESALREGQRLLKEKLKEWLKGKSSAEAQEEGQKRRLLFTKVNNTRDLLESPHFNARGYFSEVDHPVMGKARYPGAPFRLTASPAAPLKPAPMLGEANEEVLCGRLGYTREELGRLRASGAI